MGFPGGSDNNVRDPGSVPELGRSPGEGNGLSLKFTDMVKKFTLELKLFRALQTLFK